MSHHYCAINLYLSSALKLACYLCTLTPDLEGFVRITGCEQTDEPC